MSARSGSSGAGENTGLGGLFDRAASVPVARVSDPSPKPVQLGLSEEGVIRTPQVVGKVLRGKGMPMYDPRKWGYDRVAARSQPVVSSFSSKIDRLDAEEAGALLNSIHVKFGIDKCEESFLQAFDDALFREHTLNGASIIQGKNGVLVVGDDRFPIAEVKELLGTRRRAFYRAFADDIAESNQRALDALDPYDSASVELHGQIMQVAWDRGLQKFPHLAHDSASACVRISAEERLAVMASARYVFKNQENVADALPESEE